MRLREYRTIPIRMRGGINTLLSHYEEIPTRPLDLMNVMPTPDGYVSAPGWAALGNEISNATFGRVNKLAALTTSGESNFVVAISGNRFLELSGGTWTSRQDANNFTMVDGEHAELDWFNDILYVGIPRTATANAIRQWTGTGNISALAGSPRNAGGVQWWGDRLVTAKTFDTDGTRRPTRIYRGAVNDPTSHPGEYTDMIASPFRVMRIKKLGQLMVVYKEHAIAVLHLTGDDLLPFEPDELPGNVGLAQSEAFADGGREHVFMALDNFYSFDGLSTPAPIGDPIASIVYDNLAAASYMLGLYDTRSPQREAYWFISNVALAADDVGPGSVASTYTYWVYDVTTKAWARGDTVGQPRATGNRYNRFGYIDDSPISQYTALVGLDSSGGSTVYELDYSAANRAGASFTRRLLSTIFDGGNPFKHKQVSDAIIRLKRQASGNFTLSWRTASEIGDVPTEQRSLTFSMTGTTFRLPITLSARLHQFELSWTVADAEVSEVVIRMRERN